MSLSRRFRVLRQGLLTVLNLRRQGWFIPHRYADRMPVPTVPYAALEAYFQRAEPIFHAVLDQIESYGPALLACNGPPPEPRFDQGWFPRLDAAAAYALVRARAPGRIVEIGSGHSTRFLARAVKDGQLATRITAIDPQPRADVNALPIDIRRAFVQDIDPADIAALDSGDVLFIDSSHIAMPGTDVDLFVTEIIPRLPAGVLVHVHDIFLPDPYPDSQSWRQYNEAQIVAALLAGGGFRPVFSSAYVVSRMADRVTRGVLADLPLGPDYPESSLWLEKTSPALVV